jgi:Zn-dependent peptidase ImmA (M78 family)
MNKGANTAIQLRKTIGIHDPNEIELETVILGSGGYLQFKPMRKVDGRIVHGKNISTIIINSDIQYEGRKRFALAHELGHLIMHKECPIHNDSGSLDWFNDAIHQLKNGIHEYEANQFATEYLMPLELFIKEAKGQKFGPQLIHSLSKRFLTSLTSTAFRYFETNLRPIAMFHIYDGVIRYWKKSNDLKYWIEDRIKLPPPPDSVAMEYINAEYKQIYKPEELQEISKSTWFRLNEDESDSRFYEYCIVTTQYKNILSIVWED